MVSTRKKSYTDNRVGSTPGGCNESPTDEHDLCAEFHRMTVGVKEKSYLAVHEGFAVYDNKVGAVRQTGITVKPKGAAAYDVKSLNQALLVAGESQLKMLNKDGKVHALNIETEKVVQTWDTMRNGVDLPQASLTHAYKGSGCQGGGGDLLVGMTASTVAIWDCRTKKGEAAKSGGSTSYAKSSGLTCVVTGGDTGKPVGTIVAGCADGTIRVFENGGMTRADNTFKGLGQPITAVDVTYSNSAEDQWLVATTDKYLLVAQRKFLTGSGGASNSDSDASMGRILLKVKPEDIPALHTAASSSSSSVGHPPFRNGRLSYITEAGHLESCISASCGAYLLVWKFRQVKVAALCKESRKAPDYRLTSPMEQEVLDSHFMHHSYSSLQDVVLAATDTAMYAIQGQILVDD